MNAVARNHLNAIIERLERRPREADLWDLHEPEVRQHVLAKSYRRRRDESNTPALVPKPKMSMLKRGWDDLNESEQNMAALALRPYIAAAEAMADGGHVDVS